MPIVGSITVVADIFDDFGVEAMDGGKAMIVCMSRRIAVAVYDRMRSWTQLSPSERREALAGYLLISPWIVGFLVFFPGRSWRRSS